MLVHPLGLSQIASHSTGSAQAISSESKGKTGYYTNIITIISEKKSNVKMSE